MTDDMETRILVLRERMRRASLTSSEEVRTSALAAAAADLDAMFRFRGEKVDPRQTLAWPRTGFEGIPKPVIEASYFMSGLRMLGEAVPSGNREQDLDVVVFLQMMLHDHLDPDEPFQAPYRTQ